MVKRFTDLETHLQHIEQSDRNDGQPMISLVILMKLKTARIKEIIGDENMHLTENKCSAPSTINYWGRCSALLT